MQRDRRRLKIRLLNGNMTLNIRAMPLSLCRCFIRSNYRYWRKSKKSHRNILIIQVLIVWWRIQIKWFQKKMILIILIIEENKSKTDRGGKSMLSTNNSIFFRLKKNKINMTFKLSIFFLLHSFHLSFS